MVFLICQVWWFGENWTNSRQDHHQEIFMMVWRGGRVGFCSRSCRNRRAEMHFLPPAPGGAHAPAVWPKVFTSPPPSFSFDLTMDRPSCPGLWWVLVVLVVSPGLLFTHMVPLTNFCLWCVVYLGCSSADSEQQVPYCTNERTSVEKRRMPAVLQRAWR